MRHGRRLRIAHVHTAMTGSGGDRVSELEAACLSRRGHEVAIVGPVTAPIDARLRDANIAIHDEKPEQRRAEATSRDLGKLDIVHCHCMGSSPFAAELAKASSASLLLHNHNMGEEWWECATPRAWLHPGRRKRRKDIDAAVAAAHRVLCVSEPVVAHMRDLGLPTDKCVVIPNPIGEEFLAREAAAEDSYDVCIVARASKQKRPLTLLRILAEAERIDPELRVVWVGRIGHWRGVLKSAAGLLGLRNLAFVGAVEPSTVRSILDASRVLLSASKYEGQPLAVLEALARGCSVVLSDIPAHRASFSRLHGASFFAEGDVKGAANLLIRAVEEHVRTPRIWLEDEHGLQAHCQRIEHVYFDALGVKSGVDAPCAGPGSTESESMPFV